MNNLNILIVEDESLIALSLQQLILNFGYTNVQYATYPKQASKIILEEKIDLILMDINLKSNITGIDLYQSWHTDIPVIYITAYNDEDTIDKAIQTNPLGYMIKPCKEDELNALLRLADYKIKNNNKFIINTNDMQILGKGYYFNKSTKKLYFNDMYINLGTKELKLLQLLVSAKGHIIDFKTIEYELWNNGIVSPSAIQTLVYRLRGKLEYKIIETVLHQGLRLREVYNNQ